MSDRLEGLKTMIRRSFADLPTRQVHYRHAGEGPLLLMIHASPGSAKQLERKIDALSKSRRVIAPDTPGNGDSTPLDNPAPAIADYAAALVEFLDAMKIERCDIYGTHTGANIALELAVRSPERVGKVILDGIGLYPAEERQKYLANYAQTMTPDLNGSQFLKAFMFCRDQYIFWPWFETGPENRREGGLPDPMVLHDWTLEVCKAITTYPLGYRAAFANAPQDRFPHLKNEILFMAAENDPLAVHMRQAAAMVPGSQQAALGHNANPGYTESMVAAVEAFLSAPPRAPA